MTVHHLTNNDRRQDFFFKTVSEPAKNRLRGTFLLKAGDLALIGIDKSNTNQCPQGFRESSAGFYYTYLRGTGRTERINQSIHFPGHSPREYPMFIQLWSGSGPLTVDLSNTKTPTKISIIGGCCSRDALELDTHVGLSEYRARTSFASLASPPLAYLPDSIFESIPSKFQRKMVRGDLLKDSLRSVSLADGKFVVVDFMIERRKLILAGETVITVSKEFSKLNLRHSDLPGPVRSIDGDSEEYFSLFTKGWRYAVQQLAMAGKTVLVNEIFWATQNDQGIPFDAEMVRTANEKLKRLYDIVRTETPEAQWLKYDSDHLVADSQHKWGESPYHFVNGFYKSQIAQIERFASSETEK